MGGGRQGQDRQAGRTTCGRNQIQRYQQATATIRDGRYTVADEACVCSLLSHSQIACSFSLRARSSGRTNDERTTNEPTPTTDSNHTRPTGLGGTRLACTLSTQTRIVCVFIRVCACSRVTELSRILTDRIGCGRRRDRTNAKRRIATRCPPIHTTHRRTSHGVTTLICGMRVMLLHAPRRACGECIERRKMVFLARRSCTTNARHPRCTPRARARHTHVRRIIPIACVGHMRHR